MTSENRGSRSAAFAIVAHLRENRDFATLRFRAMARLVGDRFGLLELADQRILFSACFQCRERRRVQTMASSAKYPSAATANAAARNCRICRSAHN